MTRIQTFLAVTMAGALAAGAAAAADKPVKIGMITTLSVAAPRLASRLATPSSCRRSQGRQAGRRATELIVADDAQKVENAKQIATRLLKKDDVDIVTGIVWSNLALAVVPSVTREGKIYVSTNAGPHELAGKGCDKNYFNAAYQNDNLHEAAGQYVTDQGLKRVYLMAPNYPAGQGFDHRLQALLQGRSRGRGLHHLGPGGLCR